MSEYNEPLPNTAQDDPNHEYFVHDSKGNNIIEDIGILDTAIRVVRSERFQRFCLKCGKILPTKIKQNYIHNCEKPDFL